MVGKNKGDVCEFAICKDIKNEFITICDLTSEKCHANHQDKTWCKDWKDNRDRRIKYG